MIGWNQCLRRKQPLITTTTSTRGDIAGMLFFETRLRTVMGPMMRTIMRLANAARGGGADSDSDEEAPEAANAEDSDEDDSSIRTFTTARLDAANASGGSGSARLATRRSRRRI
nr:hypothetical protein CFP56_46299 [Quercus suber]